MAETVTCIECGDTLPEERAELGYRYCTKKACQALHHRGVAITAIGVNKSADHFIVADADEVRRRGEAGEFGKKGTHLSVADITDDASLQEVRAYKKQMKAAAKAANA